MFLPRGIHFLQNALWLHISENATNAMFPRSCAVNVNILNKTIFVSSSENGKITNSDIKMKRDLFLALLNRSKSIWLNLIIFIKSLHRYERCIIQITSPGKNLSYQLIELRLHWILVDLCQNPTTIVDFLKLPCMIYIVYEFYVAVCFFWFRPYHRWQFFVNFESVCHDFFLASLKSFINKHIISFVVYF